MDGFKIEVDKHHRPAVNTGKYSSRRNLADDYVAKIRSVFAETGYGDIPIVFTGNDRSHWSYHSRRELFLEMHNAIADNDKIQLEYKIGEFEKYFDLGS